MVVVVGAAVRRALDESTLSLLVVDARRARSVAPYDKQHLFADEREFFTPGDHGASIVVDGWDLALGVCYDGCFPEHAAAASGRRRDGVPLPAAYFVGAEHRRDLYYAARALDNGIYVVFAGLTGRAARARSTAAARSTTPRASRWSGPVPSRPRVVVADLDPAEVRRVQALNPIAAGPARHAGHAHPGGPHLVTAALSPAARAAALDALASTELDVLVVGGGVVGAGTALDAVTRGLTTGLVEQRDFASGTSSRSSKLIHGGLRYLEMLDFGLVREALQERGLLLTRLAPHLVRPVPFLYPLTHRGWERPYVGAGLALYDAMAHGREVRHGPAPAPAPVQAAGARGSPRTCGPTR